MLNGLGAVIKNCHPGAPDRIFSYLILAAEIKKTVSCFNPLNAELNPICHLLALLGAHNILHISMIRVNSVLHEESEIQE